MASPSYLDDEEKKLAPDFRSRYAAETSGMPADLAAIASRNLAAQDAALTRVNAASRIAAQSTPPGEPLAPFPTSDLGPPTSGGSATLSDLHTDDIATRRAAIEDQKKQIQARLGIIKPADAGLAAVVLANPHERKDLLGNLAVLEHESDNLLRENHYNAIDAARTAHENLSRSLHIQSSNGLAKILNGIADIKEPIGSEEHTAAALKLLGSNDPDIAAARGTPGFEKILGPYAQQAKTSAERAARIKEMANEPADQYHSPEALLKDNPGAEYRQDPKTGGYYVALGGQEKSKPNAIYIKQATALAEAKASKDAAYNQDPKTDLTGHDQTIAIEQAKLDAIKEALGIQDPSPTPAESATPAASATPDLKALAQKAINDPNASEAHKAAARKLLGQ